MSASSERQRLEAEYQDLNYLWEEEVFSAHPDWEKLEQWDLELQRVEHALARLEWEERLLNLPPALPGSDLGDAADGAGPSDVW